jgi:hypothetical protein
MTRGLSGELPPAEDLPATWRESSVSLFFRLLDAQNDAS